MTPWTCGRCGRSGEVGDEVVIVFHECRPPRGPRRAVSLEELLDLDLSADEERAEWWRGHDETSLADVQRAAARRRRLGR